MKDRRGFTILVILQVIFLLLLFVILFLVVVPDKKEIKENNMINEIYDDSVSNNEIYKMTDISEIKIEDYYITNTGYFFNIYTIDENGILWGCGQNDYGQLGQSYKDDIGSIEIHEEKVKIAENVIHVDVGINCSFVIYLTSDHKLYGFGTSAKGELLTDYEESYEERYGNDKLYTVNSPKLLMENVKYAVCGRNDVVCILDDNSLWTWGTVYSEGPVGAEGSEYYYVKEPKKILDDVIFVTGGTFNHAAICMDGTLWTWGYNYAGNCGIATPNLISEPVQVSDNVKMVWTNRTSVNIKETQIEEMTPDVVINDLYNQTLIEKKDGTYWICGLNVGDEKKELSIYYEVENTEIFCSSDFIPYDR